MNWPFAEWGAEAVFFGHCHSYERLEVGGIPYIVTGFGGGGGLYQWGEIDEHSVERYNSGFGAVLVEITPESLIISAQTVADGQIDEILIKKPESK
jgi:hypothetical protein